MNSPLGPIFRNKQLLSFLAGVISALTCVTIYKSLTYTQPITSPHRKRVLFFGDSITQHGFNVDIRGWVSQLANWWTRRVDIVNRGFSGYNSRWGRLIVDEIVIEEKPDFVFVFFGANDAVDPIVLQHVPLDEYESNMKEIISKIQQKLVNVPLILITAPPVWEQKLEEMNKMKGKKLHLDRTNDRTYQYVQLCHKLGKQFSVPVVDIWAAMEGATVNRAEYLSDGLHLSAKGCDKLFEEAKKVILSHFPEWSPDLMKMQLLEWSQIGDGKNPIIK